jgi:hypothetical protein
MRASRVVLSNVVWLLVAAFGLAGCGHHGSMTPSPTATSVAIHSSGPTLFLGANETFTATITFSDGSTAAVTAGTWSTDAGAIATVDSTGKVTSHASGSVTVIVDASGVRGTKTIRVLPNYGGNWKGAYGIGNCRATGTLVFTCEDLDDTFPRQVTYVLTQTGDAVTGTWTMGFLSGTITATVAGDGTLAFVSTASPAGSTKHYTGTWHFSSTTDGVFSGTVDFTGNDSASVLSTLTFDAIISNVTRL